MIGAVILSVWTGLVSLQAAEIDPSEKGYFRRHVWHWAIAFGASLADGEYEDRVGTSSDPLLFSDPPWADRRGRDWFAREDAGKPFFEENTSKIALTAGVATIVFANLGEKRSGRWMADDATGLLEVWFFDKGASGLVKNIVGRQRPELEYLDDQEDLTPEERAEEMDKRSNRQSFYSGAASRQFALMSYVDAIVAGRTQSRAARVASFLGFYSFASYAGYTRLRQDRHYVSDVVAGAAAGIFTGRGFYKAHHRPPRVASRRPRLRLESLALLPGGAAVLFSVGP
ncbi:MAG TPA: phosphatase PAP2 family protein [Candidatus Polarisedimenticolia bacterium]|nr:phosphatase PAP2 family protein [Candidatus Polarisedimenticolia bacterium]